MSKDLEINLLFDFYGELLTENQRNMLDLYYSQDLSLAEIANEVGISRQGVRDSISRAEIQLKLLESKLRLAQKFKSINKSLSDLEAMLSELVEKKEIFQIINDIKKSIL